MPSDPLATRLTDGSPNGGVYLVPGASPLVGYTLVKRLGKGGCGEVWRATAPGGVPIALKFIPLDGPAGSQEMRAFELMKEVRHPRLLSMIWAMQEDGHLIIAMQLADATLSDRRNNVTAQGQAGIPREELLRYMSEAAEGIDHLNIDRKIQHRDIKPHNLLLVGGSVQVADFGLARLLEQSSLTRTAGNFTLYYTPPESLLEEPKFTPWSDQYSLAVSYCELRGNRKPFQGSNPAQLIAAHLKKSPDLSMLPPAEEGAVGRALAKDPHARWPDCRAFVRELASRFTPVPEITNSLGMKLVWVPRGTFWMGDRGRQREVEVPRDFYVGACPVTQEQWQAVMGNNPSWFSRGGQGAGAVKNVSDADLKQFPVESVSWKGARKFIERLNAREKERGGGLLYRLPTEAEWEYACRGAANSQKGCDFDFYLSRPAGELAPGQANFGSSPGRTTKVDSYGPNRLGIHDMHGNVWEWCEDGGSARVLRGGCWGADAAHCRASIRFWYAPAHRNNNLGFRIAAVPPGD